MKPTMSRSADRSIAVVLALMASAMPAIALAADVQSVSVAPGEAVQLKVPVLDPNDPTPIIIDQAVGPLDVTLAGAPQAGATVLMDGSSAVIRTAFLPDPAGLPSDSIAVTISVPGDAPAGATVNVPPAVSVTNPDPAVATSDTSPRTTDLGVSPIPLLASTVAIFPVQTQSSAVFAPPASGTFFALALQNPAPDASVVSVDLRDASGLPVASATLTLPSLTKVSSEVSQLFPGVVAGAGSVLAVTTSVPVQMLGISGNQNDGTVRPVLPAPASP